MGIRNKIIDVVSVASSYKIINGIVKNNVSTNSTLDKAIVTFGTVSIATFLGLTISNYTIMMFDVVNNAFNKGYNKEVNGS
ncbi:MAG: hypothetical protein ABWY25_09655 [Paenisporosarcina sp.]